MENKAIAIINGINIVTVQHQGEIYVPIKPICKAIGVNYTTQLEKLKSHPILSSTIPLRGTVGADGKDREMVCLPLKYVYGWLFTINPGNVSEEARQNVVKYQMECYDVLYRHFSGALRRRLEENEAEINALKRVNDAINREKEARADRKKAEEDLEKIRVSRLDNQPTIPFD